MFALLFNSYLSSKAHGVPSCQHLKSFNDLSSWLVLPLDVQDFEPEGTGQGSHAIKAYGYQPRYLEEHTTFCSASRFLSLANEDISDRSDIESPEHSMKESLCPQKQDRSEQDCALFIPPSSYELAVPVEQDFLRKTSSGLSVLPKVFERAEERSIGFSRMRTSSI
jgi:hypothetical protein